MDTAATAPSRYWAELTSPQLAARAAAGAIAVLPLGATEQHGPHLPLGVDTLLADGLVAAALPHLAAGLDVLFLPTQPVGLSPEHTGLAGTLTLSPATLIALWTDIGVSVAAAGVRTLVLLNTHGGHVGALDVVARDLRARLGLLVFTVNAFELPLPDAVLAPFSADERRLGVHAGQLETAQVLALRPDLVDGARLADFGTAARQRNTRFPALASGQGVRQAWHILDLNPQGAAGNAAAATAEQGRALLGASGQALARALSELRDFAREWHAGRAAPRA